MTSSIATPVRQPLPSEEILSPNSPSTDKLTRALSLLTSNDVLTQNEGVELAIEIGPEAVPRLMALFDQKGSNRSQVMYALAQIADSRSAATFATGLEDSDERVRAYSAQGLAQIGDPNALSAAIRTLDDAPDELHLDMTPSVRVLGGMGLKAVAPLLDLLLAENEMTRLHAQRALESIMATHHGFVSGKGYPSEEAGNKMLATWRANGNYDYAANLETRRAAVSRWKDWLFRVKGQL